jgi:hypothetical protein
MCLPPGPDTDCLATCPEFTVCSRGACVDALCTNPFFGPSYQSNNIYLPHVNQGFEYAFGGPYPQDMSGPLSCAAPDSHVGLCSYLGLCCDIANDPQNCGGFGFVCPAGQTCSSGVCSGQTSACGIGRIGAFCNLDAGISFACCPGVGCTDTNIDPANCGGCNNACAIGQSCVAGTCT